MRADAGPQPAMDHDAGSFPFAEVEGAGVYEIPVGPVHAGSLNRDTSASGSSARPLSA